MYLNNLAEKKQLALNCFERHLMSLSLILILLKYFSLNFYLVKNINYFIF